MKRQKSKARIKENGSEGDYMLIHVWGAREHICDVCKKRIQSPKPYCFAHILPKGTYPKYRYDANNIVLVCSIEHHNIVDKHQAGIKYLIEQKLKTGERVTFNDLLLMKNGTD